MFKKKKNWKVSDFCGVSEKSLAARVQGEFNKEHLKKATVGASSKGKTADSTTHRKAARKDLYVQTLGKFANGLNAPLPWMGKGRGRLTGRTHTESGVQWEKLGKRKNPLLRPVWLLQGLKRASDKTSE